MSISNSLWCIKYRPSTIDQYAFSSIDHAELIAKIVETKNIPHLLLSGPPGTGKSSLALLLAKLCIDPDDYASDVLVINASDNNSVDDMREMIKNHITSFANGPYKLVILQEADYLTQNAQGILRDYMEVYESHARFILTCNALHKIDAAIKSRCQKLVIDTPDKKTVTVVVSKMLIAENVRIPVIDHIYDHIDQFYPDVRSIIQSLQQCSSTGALKPPSGSMVTSEITDAVLKGIRADAWMNMAKELPKLVPDYGWEDFFEIVYNNLELSPKFHAASPLWGEGILTICEYMVNSNCAKPAINGAAFCVQMDKHIKSIKG